jgi:hypothetical protein
MNPKDDGGPAFPSFTRVSEWNENAATYIEQSVPVGGMSLRDYFAGQVVQGCGGWPSQGLTAEQTYDVTAGFAYKVADAMLRARAAAPDEAPR